MTQPRFVNNVIPLDKFSCKLTIIFNFNRIAAQFIIMVY
ncbi:hypothetical protein LEPN108286_02345 [Legionella pneumophila subsp. pneumophila]